MTKPTVPSFCAAALLTLALCATSASCARNESAEPTAPAPSASDAPPPVDPALLAFLSLARAAHHRADLLEEQSQPDRATAELERVLEAPQPRSDRPYPEVTEVLADTRARLADLKSQVGRFDQAAADVAAGLRLATDRTYFRGHLFEVSGHVEERRARALRERGQEAAAKQAETRALTAFEEAMRIQEEVIRTLTGPEAQE